MNIQRVVLNEMSYFGPNARSVLASEIEKRNYKKILIVTDKTLIEAGVTPKVLQGLGESYIQYDIFSDIKPNPTVSSVKLGVKKCEDINADCIVAVGGGSVIDTAKAIAIIITNSEFSDVVSLDGVANTKNKCLPIIALPTTFGTAAEVTINYVITDEDNMKKMVCIDPHDIPILSIVDTELMKEMPHSVAASTGMDALTHALEGYLTKGAWCMTDMFHLEAIRIIYHNIIKAVEQKDPVAIDQMGIGQYIAGMGFSNVGLGIVHSMAHQLGAIYDTPHGLANAVLLPYVLMYNGPVCVEKYKEICKIFNIEIINLSEDEVIKQVVNSIRKLNDRLFIPRNISVLGVKDSDLDLLSQKAYTDICTGGNPRETSAAEILEIYRQAF